MGGRKAHHKASKNALKYRCSTSSNRTIRNLRARLLAVQRRGSSCQSVRQGPRITRLTWDCPDSGFKSQAAFSHVGIKYNCLGWDARGPQAPQGVDAGFLCTLPSAFAGDPMSLSVAARFDTFSIAQEAARALFADGFDEEEVTIFFVNPTGQHDRLPAKEDREAQREIRDTHRGAGLGGATLGAAGAAIGSLVCVVLHLPIWLVALAAAVGAYIGTLVGAMYMAHNAHEQRLPGRPTAMRHSGVLVAVHVSGAREAHAATVLREHGGKDVERALGRWQHGEWVDFDPESPPVLSDKVSAQDPIRGGGG